VITSFGQTGGWGIQPSWTPDGSRVVFVGEDAVRTHPNVAFVAPDGASLQRRSDEFNRAPRSSSATRTPARSTRLTQSRTWRPSCPWTEELPDWQRVNRWP
jgi:Tol biopolymer transport system component